MIAKATDRGSRTRGLIEYLFGPGRADEHANPRVVAGWDPGFIRTAGEATLSRFERGLLAAAMDAPMRLHGIAPGGHVYHVPVSVHVNDGELTDDQWRQVAEEAADKLGLTAGPDRSPAPWIAVRHGRSSGGQDHIHFVAVAYRESGQKVDLWNDYAAWEEVRANAEDRWDLTRTRRRGGGIPDHKRGEIERGQREGRGEPARQTLARTVRGCAGAARDEADFLHRLRRSGVLVRPRWQRGGQTSVVGYSVALRAKVSGEKPIWYGGGRLAEDLNLAQLRARWGEPGEAQAADALRAWRPRGWRRLPTGRQITAHRLRAEAWEAASAKTVEVRQALARLDPQDAAGWSAVSRDAADVLAALSQRVEIDHRGELRRAADSLARAAQTDRRGQRHVRRAEADPLAGVVRVAMDAVLAAQGGPYAVAVLVMQLGRLVGDIAQANTEGRRAVQAQRASLAAGEMLTFVRHSPTAELVHAASPSGERTRRQQHGVVTRPWRRGSRGDDRQR